MNIAIILGVSKYVDAKNNLPGCKNDADALHKILQKTEKFNPILYINENETSAKTKDLITRFIIDHKGKPIDELFFYYSGHGEFANDEFYYLLSDYDSKKRNQTSLQNSEIDDLIKTLNPNLVIKVIDACQSGASYIKESNVLAKYFNESKNVFKKCYFLNSSLNNQSSYQNNSISFFTNSFISALKQHATEEIRYKDIIDVISDDFVNNQDQTPFFVIQADYTEKFCAISKALREYLNNFDVTKLSVDIAIEDKAISLVDIIKQDAKNYVDKEGAIQCLEMIRKEYSNFKLKGEMGELFTVNVDFQEDYRNVQKKQVIANWISKYPNEFFAKIRYERYWDEEGDEHTVTEFELKVDVPYNTISIVINNNFENISSYNCTIVFLLSRKSIRFFYSIASYIEQSWDNKILNYSDINWLTAERKIADKDAVLDGIKTINDSIQVRLEDDLRNKFNIPNTKESEEEVSQSNIVEPAIARIK